MDAGRFWTVSFTTLLTTCTLEAEKVLRHQSVPQMLWNGRKFSRSRRALSRTQTRPSKKEKGLVTVEPFLGCAESAVLVFGKLIRFPNVT